MIREHPLELARMEGVSPQELEKNSPGEIRSLEIKVPAK